MSEGDLELEVLTQEKIVYKGMVKSLSSTNTKGRFDILAKHSNFISLVNDNLIIIENRGKRIDIPIERAVMMVTSNKIYVIA